MSRSVIVARHLLTEAESEVADYRNDCPRHPGQTGDYCATCGGRLTGTRTLYNYPGHTQHSTLRHAAMALGGLPPDVEVGHTGDPLDLPTSDDPGANTHTSCGVFFFVQLYVSIEVTAYDSVDVDVEGWASESRAVYAFEQLCKLDDWFPHLKFGPPAITIAIV